MDTTVVSVILGLILPFVVSFLKGQQWSDNTKMLFSMGVAIVAAAATLLVQNDFDWNALLTNAATVWATAQLLYRTWFQNTSAEVKLASALPWSKPVQ